MTLAFLESADDELSRQALTLAGLLGGEVRAVPVERPASKLEKLRLVVPEGSRKQAEILGEGPGAAPRVVEVMQQLGVA